MNTDTDKTKKPRRKALIVLIVVLAVILVLAAGALIAIHAFLNQIDRIDTEQTFPTLDIGDVFEESEPVETDPTTDQAELVEKDKDIVNFLLVGQDRRANEGQSPQRTDAMILCTLNKNTKTLTMTSFMRDLWVYIPDKYNARLNTPYKLGGFPLLNQTLDYNFGVSADYNIEIDFSGFMEAIDLVGGVQVELTGAEAEYLNRRGNWDVEENQHWKLKAGVNLLTGSQALAYSRIRQIGTDFGRTNRQRTVLTALIEKAKTLSATQILDLAKQIMPLLATDMTNNQMIGLILDVLPILPELQIVSQRIPTDKEYTFAKKGGADVIVLSKSQLETNRALLATTMGK